MMPSMNVKTETTIQLPLAFILYSLIAFVVSQCIFLLHVDTFIGGVYRTPNLWMGTHFLLLGWAVMVVMGAMYQLVPVAFLTPIWNERFGYVQFGITAMGITTFAIFLKIRPDLAVHAGGFAVLGVVMFLFQMVMTIRKQPQPNTMTWFVGAALLSFFTAILAGFGLSWNMAFGINIDHKALLQSHLVFGLIGWFSLLIFGFSYKMVPMFSLSHGFSMKWAKPAFFVYIAGMVSLLSSFWLDVSVLPVFGWFLLWTGFTCFGLDIKEIVRKRIKKKLDQPFRFSLLSILFGWFLHSGAFILALVAPTNQKLWGLIIYLYLMIWIIFSIVGYLFKIVPFLWWTHKYSSRMGQENVPTLKEMMNEKVGSMIYISFIIGVFGITFASVIQSSIMAQVFQFMILITTILYSMTIARVLWK
ncbi:hypothetical protein [Pontibacillus sp. HMF3514]|uniref:hypothetical protein n=1 Tax=Pontibacillus sp. HMF3514 TaxID=2692425 RepID=UPI001F17986E|nr:hypothetical protein [Pontibacillus sp. HMF3514]